MPVARAVLLVTLLVPVALPDSARAEHPAQELHRTTETLEYCQVLARRLDAMPGRFDPAPRLLGQQGRRLCAHGHIKTGIARLRRAIRLAASQQSDGG